MMKGSVLMYLQLATVAMLALACSLAFASNPSPLQDFCVAVDKYDSTVFVNGRFCKEPKDVKVEDFFCSGLNVAGDTSGRQGSNVIAVTVNELVGLNTLGISLARIDFAPYGLNPPHTHPRGTEVLFVMEGTLYVGFVTSNEDDGNRLFNKVLNARDVFVFPNGLVHFQFDTGKSNAIAFAGLSNQNPGIITIANAVFGSEPPINPDILTQGLPSRQESG